MKIFLSYPSEDRAAAERLQYALLAQGHDVFFDRSDLAAGQEYDGTIGREIADSDLFIFFITPASVSAGRYTLTELGLAERKWPHPGGRVLPVMVRATEIEAVPAYLRAVNFLVPRGDLVAETAQETQRLARALPLATRVGRQVKARKRTAAIIAVALVGLAIWGGLSLRALTGGGVTQLPADLRYRARAVAPMADGGFVVATAAPAQLVRFSPSGARVGEPLTLRGEPVSATPSGTQILVITRAPDGVTVLDWKNLRLIDTVWLDPTTVRRPREVPASVKLSGDIQSVAVRGGMLWVTTGERDGEPAVLRFLWERRWDLPSWALRPEGIFGGDARGLALRRVNKELWGVTTATTPSSLLHPEGFTRVDEFRGHDLRMVSCAHDLAPSAAGNLLVLSCDNELQEISVDVKTLTLVGARPTLPSESGPNTWTDEIILPDSSAAVVALNTEVGLPNNRPGHARIAEVDSAGVVRTLLDVRDAVVRSMALTRRTVVAVLRRADGRFEAVVAPRAQRDVSP